MLAYPDIDPVVFHIGPLPLRWYGLMYLLGFATGWLLGKRRAAMPGSGWTPAQWDDLLTWMILSLILGARLGYVLFYDLPFYLENPKYIVMIWKGGMSFHGGLLGLIVCFWIFARKNGMGFLQVSDFVAPLAPPGLLFGRLGNFINAELWGRVTDSPLGMVFPDPAAGRLPRHPSQLYEACLEGLVLFSLLYWHSSRPRHRGETSGLFLVLYGSFRFVLEFFRQPDPQLGFVALGWMSMGQALCLSMAVPGLALFLLARKGVFDPRPAA